jgi:large subunit ribosomal protein L25
MSEKFVVEARKREKTGKGDARKLRARGFVPAVVYGADQEPEHVYVDRVEITKIFHHEPTIIDLKIGSEGKTTPVIIRSFDKDPISDELIHLDFQRVKMDEEISATVPIVLINEESCKGVKMGGIIQHGLREIEVECLPQNLPTHIEVDIKDLEIGDVIKVADLKLPETVKVAEDPEEIIVSIVPPAVYEEVEETGEVPEVPTVAETEKKAEE